MGPFEFHKVVGIRNLDISIKRFDKRLEVAQNAGFAGGPEGVRANGPNNPSLSAISDDTQADFCIIPNPLKMRP